MNKQKDLSPENQEFIALLNASGWSQAEAARRLHLTRGGVNHIVAGRAMPSLGVIKLFKLILASEQPDVIGSQALAEGYAPPDDAWARAVIEELRQFPPEDREKMAEKLAELLKVLPRPRVVYRKVTTVAKASQQAALEASRKLLK